MSDVDRLKERLSRRDDTIGVIGLGYVGLPLILRFGEVGFRVIGFDVDTGKVKQLNDGASYIQNVSAARVQDGTTAFEASRRTKAIEAGCIGSLKAAVTGW